ncbi:uncharacterized LabA/DUF88 family protein [Catenuloplanes nepalensis]|uniref:Uncharacterized LabA/DUF88 family protein n=1 Tax=Catenuloplanes nepalensis TaxID=587533 RepID=A0ABT9N8N7_9ACTN|nr:NYN domain-containing protein [Catenuloplanes nepalensis]MDP9799596.1 uncharacterized LabA/DUF88 family protein [Catenuloplanes nepalensis]
MGPVRAALYLDFDNVFSGLLKQDPGVAMQFAEEPGGWLERLATSLTVDGPRRWLILRCYLNPNGSVPAPDPALNGPRLYFSRFRPSFTKAGFEVIDCPRLTHTKNAADIRMVVDALDAMLSPTRYDEFVIASGDSDMTPLLVRLRAADRRTTVVSPFDAAEAFTSVADRLVGSEHLLELIQGEPVEGDDDAPMPTMPAPPPLAAAPGRDEALTSFGEIIATRLAAADGPLNLASLAHDVRRQLDTTNWFGYGTFVKALYALRLPTARYSSLYLWDISRHTAPPAGATLVSGGAMPEPVARLCLRLELPRLTAPTWAAIYDTLAEFAGSHPFNLTEATRWSRDQLAGRGIDVGRQAIAFVTRGAAYGGCPLFRVPAPSAAEIADAFVSNVLQRAEAAEIALTVEDERLVRAWLHNDAPPENGRDDASAAGTGQEEAS